VARTLTARLEQASPFVLVNNAGFRRDTLLAMMKDEDWRAVIDVTLSGFFNVTKAVLPGMIHRRAGRIINISSAAAHFGVAGQVNYSAAKAGLLGATRSLAAEVAKRGVLVNAVSPGFTDTEMLNGLPLEQIKKTIPLGRLGTADEIAAAVAFLTSPSAAYITGQVIQVNGGIGA
jgi:3-oxoacyl-[acyl-carrier protein] reductase